MKKTTAERRGQLEKEFETHSQIKKDIEAMQREVLNLLIIYTRVATNGYVTIS